MLSKAALPSLNFHLDCWCLQLFFFPPQLIASPSKLERLVLQKLIALKVTAKYFEILIFPSAIYLSLLAAALAKCNTPATCCHYLPFCPVETPLLLAFSHYSLVQFNKIGQLLGRRISF